jgi:hypothetical protein
VFELLANSQTVILRDGMQSTVPTMSCCLDNTLQTDVINVSHRFFELLAIQLLMENIKITFLEPPCQLPTQNQLSPFTAHCLVLVVYV